MEDERFDLARSYFEDDLKRRPDRLETMRKLCLAWQRGANQALVVSIECTERYLERAPDDQVLLRLLIDSYLTIGSHEAALALADALDDSASAWSLRARTLVDVDPEAARDAIERAIGLDGESSQLRLVAADVARRLGDREGERDRLREAVDRNPLDDRARYRFGRALLLTGDRERGARELALSGRLANLRGELPSNGGQAVTALRTLHELAGAVDLDHPFVAALRARLLFDAGRAEEGAALLNRIEARRSLTLDEQMFFAGRLARVGHAEEAIERYRLLQASERPARAARLALARLLRNRGEGDEAESILRAALVDDPHTAHFHAELGDLLLRAGREDEAAAELETALELAPWQAPWRVELAQIELAAGRRAEAERLLAAAPEPSPRIARFRREHFLEAPGGSEQP